MRTPDPATQQLLPRRPISRWLGLLSLPLLFVGLSLGWLNFSESLLRIAAPDPVMLPVLRTLNNSLFILFATLFWTFWLVRQNMASRRRETVLRLLLEQAPAPLALARKGKVLACNPAFSTLFDQPDPRALQGYDLLAHIPAQDLPDLLGQIKEMDPRHPRTARIETRIEGSDKTIVPLVFLVRRFLLGRSVHDLLSCRPREAAAEDTGMRGELELQLLESLPRPLWLWTNQGLCLWSNQAARTGTGPEVRQLIDRYGRFQDGHPLSPTAQREFLQPALKADGCIAIALTGRSGSESPLGSLCVLPVRGHDHHIQAIAAVLEPPVQTDDTRLANDLFRGLNRVLQQLQSQPQPDVAARIVLETLQLRLAPNAWVGILQADLSARSALFWSLSATGELDHYQTHLPPDLPTECGAPGWSDITSLTGPETLPGVMARLEQAGVDRFERILADPVQGHRQVLLLSRPLPAQIELRRLWASLILAAAQPLLQPADFRITGTSER